MQIYIWLYVSFVFASNVCINIAYLNETSDDKRVMSSFVGGCDQWLCGAIEREKEKNAM